MDQEKSDVWADWLLHHRHGNDANFQQNIQAEITLHADRILDGVKLEEGMTLADIGTGDGLVAFRAIDRIGSSLQVVMTDISPPLINYVQARAAEQGVLGQCRFIQGSADTLTGMDDSSVDAVTTRSALAYVADKAAAFREIHRVLKPGRYLSIAEPIMLDAAFEVCVLKRMVEARESNEEDLFFPMMLRWRSALYPDTEAKMRDLPITSFGERDLVRYAVDAGFTDIHLEFHIDVKREGKRPPWHIFKELSPHPLAPTLSKVLAEQFTADERIFFEDKLREFYETNAQFSVDRMVWLTAQKPLST